MFWRTIFILARERSRYNTGAIDDPKLIPGYSRRQAVLKIEGVRLPEEGRDKNQWRFWSDATMSRTHVHYDHITANVLSASRAPINPKTVCRFFSPRGKGALIFVAERFSVNLLLRGGQKRGTC